jgi:soluble lytic murein transglycosylase-like protein
MTLIKRLRAGTVFLACSAALVGAAAPLPAWAEMPQALSSDDAQAYAAAFNASDRGDFIDAQMQTTAVKDKSLLGYLSFSELMHPTAHVAGFDELASWLGKFRDLPVADRIFALASKRKPTDRVDPPAPVMKVSDGGPISRPVSPRAMKAREAFYAGDAKRALKLAPAAGERWIAGLAAYRLKAYGQARGFFAELAHDEAADPWMRSAAGYWGARAAVAQGDSDAAANLLKAAARNPETFYGMIAERQARLLGLPLAPQTAVDPARLIPAAYIHPSTDLARFVESDPRAHRAAALAQIGRTGEAVQEMREGLALAESPQDREHWTALALTLGAVRPDGSPAPRAADLDYPTPELTPRSGFTIDKALVYAIVRQESRFNPMAVSPVGAVGLMQLMPEAAARAAGDDKLKADMSPLFDPALNLRVGQDYLTWLMEKGVGPGLLRTVAAYNGGPSMVQKTAQMLGGDADSLLLIECLPALETRNYVEKVMAGYWTYRRMWGLGAPSLDAVAGGAREIDARLDLPQPQGAGTKLATQAVYVETR